VNTASGIARCTVGELPGLIASLDAEFVFGRARGTSLALRYPTLLAPDNLGNIYVCREQGRVVASIAVKLFRWIVAGRDYTGAMIGMVWTDPARRGSGLASRLLAHVGENLRAQADFAVLWTAQPGIYQGAGWVAGDCASFGVIEGDSQAGARGAPADFAKVRAIWQSQTPRVERDSSWQPPLPLPADNLEMFTVAGAYAIAGRQGDELYCYEMPGDIAELDALLGQMRASCRILRVNERSGSPTQHYLSQLGVKWERKPLAMWLPLREPAAIQTAAGWYMPWLDRI
jgi:predicted N-acetyltransferase YhbS